MHLIIDGYNLLAVTATSSGMQSRLSEMAREVLLRDLAAYRQRKGHVMTVVFDGWQQGHLIEGREHRSGVQVIYSKRGEKADQVIQRLAREYGGDCAIVSSDREIVNHARAYGAFIMGAVEFAARMQAAGRPGGGITGKELDWNEDQLPKRRLEKKGNPRKLPKSQRQRNRQLKRF